MAMRTLGSAMIALIAAALTSCGGGDSGDGNEGDDPREDGGEIPGTCGNGACDSGESCGNCADCACPAGQTCDTAQEPDACVTDNTPRCGDGKCDATASETCTSCEQDCGCGADRRCHTESATCVSANPLIETMPGSWNLVEINGEPPPVQGLSDVTVDPTQPTCGCPDQALGDACVIGFDPPNFAVLSGTTLILSGCGQTLEGQVLEEGRRVEYDRSDSDGNSGHYVWQKE
ncbi:hypothetical protein HY635_03150 [Candidatus Uhrbacteria bacterium]|nr:hypothetical protein [Candidatus Uhrbacteria bacterium]